MHHFILYFDQSEDLRFGGPQGFFCFFIFFKWTAVFFGNGCSEVLAIPTSRRFPMTKHLVGQYWGGKPPF